MPLPKKYVTNVAEPGLVDIWNLAGVYKFNHHDQRPVYSIDTPPPTVSGKLHLGHTYSYTHTDIFARYWRMRERNVFYPMGYDDNGLPTERLVEKLLGQTAAEIGRQAFIEQCLQVSQQAEGEYQDLWQRLGLSIDWRYTYRTIDDCARRNSQLSFINLFRKDLVYRTEEPTIWCPECQTAFAQADVNDRERESEMVTLAFTLENGDTLPIATTRPELLPACVAIFVHPNDERFLELVGKRARVPLFAQQVTIFEDQFADPEKGTGAVMCCTFGDTTDKYWWHTYQLEHINAIDRQGKLTDVGGEFTGMPVADARQAIKGRLQAEGYLLDRQLAPQNVPVHERCDTPIELIMSQQWFIRLLDFKDELSALADEINWHPAHMKHRYQSWVENLAWDWCISRQRYYGVPFPLWYCQGCREVVLAEEEQLPVDPLEDIPSQACQCGSTDFIPERDIFDTWATSSLSPQIVGQWGCDETAPENSLYNQLFPFSLRPQAHEIIRTWAFYTIAKSHYHFDQIPWKNVAISGWGVAGEGMEKISKSRGGGPLPPLEMIDRYSADAVRYWASSTGLGKDTIVSEEKIKLGAKLVTKLWNVARFSQRFLVDYDPNSDSNLRSSSASIEKSLSPADRWILSRLQRLVRRTTDLLENYDYAAAKSEIENFFWGEFTDNYLEMCKQRLYGNEGTRKEAAAFSLYHLVLTLTKLFAPFLPFITETIYQGLFISEEEINSEPFDSIHLSRWPVANSKLEDDLAEQVGVNLVDIATCVRRFKSERGLPLSTELQRMTVFHQDRRIAVQLKKSMNDLASITRVREIIVDDYLDPLLSIQLDSEQLKVAIEA